MYICRILLVITVLLAAYVAAMTAFLVPYLWLAILAILVVAACKKGYRYSAYGTARWADAADIPHLLEGGGVILGHIDGKTTKLAGVKALFNSRLSAKKACQTFLIACQRKQPKHLVRLTNAVHTAVFAPTGVGKGVSIVIPHLLTCTDSMVVVDFKGELVKATAQARRRMGHRVVVIDPFGVAGGTDTFNPLDFIDKESRHALDDCRDLAEALVVRTGQEKEPHWADSAEVWIAAMVATVAAFADAGDKSLQSVRSLLTNPVKMQEAIKLMCESDLWEGMLARLGHQLTHFKDKELSSTLTTTNRFLRFLDTIAIADNTRRSSFAPADLLTGKLTVYLVLPPEHMRAQSPLLRLWIGSMLRAVVKNGLQEHTRVQFVLDEAASLGHMEALDDAVDKFRGYGIRLLFLYQSLGQLKLCWPENRDQTLLSNVTQVYFGVNDQQTAEYVSNRLGDATILVRNWGSNSGSSHQSSPQGGNTSYSSGTNESFQQHGRKLLQPSEVAALDPRIAVTFTPGVPPIATWLVRYYEHDFRAERGLGFFKSVFDTACLFACVSVLAVMVTAAVFSPNFKEHGGIDPRSGLAIPTSPKGD